MTKTPPPQTITELARDLLTACFPTATPRRVAVMTSPGSTKKFCGIPPPQAEEMHRLMRDHLTGARTIAACLVDDQGRALAACRDYDHGGEQMLLAALERDRLHRIVSFAIWMPGNGRDHDGGHLWRLYMRPAPADVLRNALGSLPSDQGECYPSGNCIRLPFGFHRHKRTRGVLILQNGQRFNLDDPDQLIAGIHAVLALPRNRAPASSARRHPRPIRKDASCTAPLVTNAPSARQRTRPTRQDAPHTAPPMAQTPSMRQRAQTMRTDASCAASAPDHWSNLPNGAALWHSRRLKELARRSHQLGDLMSGKRVTLIRDNCPDSSNSAQVACLVYNLIPAGLSDEEIRAIALHLHPRLRPNRSLDHFKRHIDREIERYRRRHPKNRQPTPMPCDPHKRSITASPALPTQMQAPRTTPARALPAPKTPQPARSVNKTLTRPRRCNPRSNQKEQQSAPTRLRSPNAPRSTPERRETRRYLDWLIHEAGKCGMLLKSQAECAQEYGKSLRTIKRYEAELQRMGAIRREPYHRRQNGKVIILPPNPGVSSAIDHLAPVSSTAAPPTHADCAMPDVVTGSALRQAPRTDIPMKTAPGLDSHNDTLARVDNPADKVTCPGASAQGQEANVGTHPPEYSAGNVVTSSIVCKECDAFIEINVKLTHPPSMQRAWGVHVRACARVCAGGGGRAVCLSAPVAVLSVACGCAGAPALRGLALRQDSGVGCLLMSVRAAPGCTTVNPAAPGDSTLQPRCWDVFGRSSGAAPMCSTSCQDTPAQDKPEASPRLDAAHLTAPRPGAWQCGDAPARLLRRAFQEHASDPCRQTVPCRARSPPTVDAAPRPAAPCASEGGTETCVARGPAEDGRSVQNRHRSLDALALRAPATLWARSSPFTAGCTDRVIAHASAANATPQTRACQMRGRRAACCPASVRFADRPMATTLNRRRWRRRHPFRHIHALSLPGGAAAAGWSRCPKRRTPGAGDGHRTPSAAVRRPVAAPPQ